MDYDSLMPAAKHVAVHNEPESGIIYDNFSRVTFSRGASEPSKKYGLVCAIRMTGLVPSGANGALKLAWSTTVRDE
jgi:hypothetical protein